MTISHIRPVIPGTAPGNTTVGPTRVVGHPLPLVAVPTSPRRRQSAVLYGMAAIDDRGRVADRHIIAALNWTAGTRLSIREHDGLLVVIADPHGVFTLTKQGHLRLPAHARRTAGVSSGDRVFLTADVAKQTVTVFPPIALDRLILPVLQGGEDA
jgi:hypothetical protein